MAYQGQLPGGVTVTIEQRGDQTQVSVERGSQRQGGGRTTGPWQDAPRLWQTGEGGVVEISGAQKSWLRVTDGSAQSLHAAPNLQDAQAVALTEVKDGEGQPEMKPMEPMKPMTPMGED
ncbi:hypothetical protein [Deinococcus sp. Leaf326]|uniref:hypothetical protein n=1 Tax=Deinococcus sp. Leaf326 TaxID=1736338 RepID=UPI0006FDF9BD|nr:hypothetical protein [Deinococcus sp. Leaf326]KQR04600.1 hypothetical protein ASF71_11250 [Deinococcus sp. Leaf326]